MLAFLLLVIFNKKGPAYAGPFLLIYLCRVIQQLEPQAQPGRLQ